MIDRWISNRRILFPFIVILLFLEGIQETLSANWAQASGDLEQNVVLPYMPAPDKKHWRSRYGMVTILIDSTASISTSLGSVYLLGGDSYEGTAHRVEPGVVDNQWGNGYKNDVWLTTGTEWSVRGDIRLRNGHKQKIPEVRSQLTWQLITDGSIPPPRMTYDNWIICENYFQSPKYATLRSKYCASPSAVQWSPRRHHAGVYFNGYMYIMGGRAREFVELPEIRSVGGIIGPHVQDVSNTKALSDQLLTTQREASVVKNDVWKSTDGSTWTLVTPGCKQPQRSLVAAGNIRDGRFGVKAAACRTDADCYGAEACDLVMMTCVCTMWSPREQHAVAVYNGAMYLSGGMASRLYSYFSNCGPYACGDTDASAYRYYMADIWKSTDGAQWTLITEQAFPGRGGHQMLYISTLDSVPYLWVFGGRGGLNNLEGTTQDFNDVWRVPLTSSPVTWELVAQSSPWSPRLGHTVTLQTASPSNGYVRSLYLIGGFSEGNATSFDDVWVWRLDDPSEYWRLDYTPEALFSTGDGTNFHYANNSPSVYYVSPDSDLTYLRRFFIPAKIKTKGGQRPELRPYITQEKLAMLNEVGLYSIRDLATADKYTILKLRGFDIPQVPEDQRYAFYDICDYRAFAIAVVDKCSLTQRSLYDGENQMPWNIVPVFGGAPPASQPIKWHNRRNYNFLLPGVDDPVTLIDQWDGCTYVPQIEGHFGPNVDGLGFVQQVSSIASPDVFIEELQCKWYPGPRAFHSTIYFEERLYLFGGQATRNSFYADTWYRDSQLPTARFASKPKSQTPFPWFHFVSDEGGVHFEYRVYDPINYKEIRGWTPVVGKTSIGWLSWREGGPSNGYYTMFLRAVDPAGNRDEKYESGRNVYTWYYVSPTPWDIIMEVIGSFIGLCIFGYTEYRRRVKKAAMERYAMKRMRRKFKAMQRDLDGRAVDWRTLYLESQAAEAGASKKKKDKKKQRDKKREKREKERKNREKEKERIKKKLKGGKDFKEKGKKDKDGKEKEKDKDKKGKDGEDGKSKSTKSGKKSGKSGKRKGDDGEAGGDGDGEEGEEILDMNVPLIDAKAEKAKAKAKFKEYEKSLGLPDASGSGGESGSSPGPRYKDYEKAEAAATAPPPAISAESMKLEKDGMKQRKSNKRYKDYEVNGNNGNNGNGNQDGESRKDA